MFKRGAFMFVVFVKFIIPAIILFYLFKRFLKKDTYKSTYALVLFLTSLLFNVALAQNYNFSFFPYPANDGISITNMLAYYVFGESHFGNWSTELFRNAYELSTMISLILLFVYIVLLIIEGKGKRNRGVFL
jgi:predicted neutral ceramidase superfamily lipid hydrolase